MLIGAIDNHWFVQLCSAIYFTFSATFLSVKIYFYLKSCTFRYIFLSGSTWWLAASLEPLAYRRIVASLGLFCRYYFGRCSSELAQLVPLPFSRGRSTRYSDRLHDFSVTIPRCCNDVYVNSSFPRTARLWNSLPIECFPLIYDLIGFKSRINWHILTVGSF